ncbi:MAG TPA: tRNA (adenosine(37)-N6)-threonylcarbamoyltransferase complex ATPase subunit type 1 TsaE [Ilumatobacteraceae bacterium]|jgi:tRNA threonylcarbamoyladenosine biosynthesis protein TsaE
MIQLRSRSIDDTRAIAASIAHLARNRDLIVLAGPMGAGKTAFAQGFARSLGIHEPVTSPTYTLVHTYQAGRTTLHHADLYRLEHTAEVEDLGLDEMREDSIILVEWGDVVDLGPQLRVELELGDLPARGGDGDECERGLVLTSTDRSWAPRWERLEAAVERWLVG